MSSAKAHAAVSTRRTASRTAPKDAKKNPVLKLTSRVKEITAVAAGDSFDGTFWNSKSG